MDMPAGNRNAPTGLATGADVTSPAAAQSN